MTIKIKIKPSFTYFFLALFTCSLSLSAFAKEEVKTKKPSIAQQFSKEFTDVAKIAVPSVVSIKVQTKKQKVASDSFSQNDAPDSFFNDDFWQHFFGIPNPSSPHQTPDHSVLGQGSGFIVSADGYILTNNHVIKDTSIIQVTLNDGREFNAKVIGTDPNTDIAVIKIEATNLPFLKLGNSDDLNVAQWVIAIGNPFGLQASLTVGVVSAKGRSNLDLAHVEDFIQTDAAINRGNSGGPLLDLDGDVIGMNTAIASNTGGSMGIGFAIPSNMVKHIMDQIITTGSVTRGFLGVALQRIDQDLARSFDLDKVEGGLIADVSKDSPAEKAGLKQGDVILKYNNLTVDSIGNFRNAIAFSKPGTKINLTIKRDRKILQIPIVIAEYPLNTENTAIQKSDQLGFSIQNLTPEIAQTLGYQNEKGVVITKIDPNSLSSLAGIKKGSLIIAINQEKVASVDEFNAVLAKAEKGKPVLLLIKQGQAMRFVSLKTE
jgi:serine protease Do